MIVHFIGGPLDGSTATFGAPPLLVHVPHVLPVPAIAERDSPWPFGIWDAPYRYEYEAVGRYRYVCDIRTLNPETQTR